MTTPPGHDPIGAAGAFVVDHERRLKPLHIEAARADWDLATTGLSEHVARKEALEIEIRRIFADLGAYTRVNSFDRILRESPSVDPLLRRQIHLLRLAYLEGQIEDSSLTERVRLETEIGNEFNTFRGRIRGASCDDNEIRRVLLHSHDSAHRREAWEASKEIGARVAAPLRELVRIRNVSARARGYRDYRALALDVAEIDEAWLERFLADMEERTRAPYAELKDALDRDLAKRFAQPEGALQPWHYPDPFFQEPPEDPEATLDPSFEQVDLVQVAFATFRAMGIPVDEVLSGSDLEPRPGKCQHAFCLPVDRERDVRVLANVEPVAFWAGTMLHELGHAAYELYIDPTLPFLLRSPAHPLTTEAVAMLIGRLVFDPEWLRRDAGFEASRVGALGPALARTRRSGRVVLARWCLTLIHFERQLYADPEADLDTLWWDLVERYQGVRRPVGRSAPDWAAKIHLSTSPVYYQDYLLGETYASQLQAAIRERTGRGLAGNPGAGRFLLDEVFRPGASLRWDDLVMRSTGRALDAAAFLSDV